MPFYRYKARDKHGKVQTGTMEASGREAVADQLSGAGYLPVLIEEQGKGLLSRPGVLKRFTRVRPYDLIIFSRQLATLAGAGVPFLQALISLEKQTKNRRLRETVNEIRRDVEAGAAFSEALAKFPAVFSTMYVSMIRAGETAGILEEILERLALLAEHDYETRARVKAAVRYPFIVIITLCAAFAFLVGFVIPRFATIFERFKTALPFPTRVLIGINHIVQHYWYAVLLAAVLITGGFLWYIRTQAGRRQWDRLKLRIPVFGTLLHKVAMSRFARIFSALQKSGISMLLTLDIAAETVGNVVIARTIESMRESVREGRTLAAPMEESGLFPPLVVQMTAVGEESGRDLNVMLAKVSEYYDRDVEYALRNLSTVIEPVLLLVVGGMVLFLALGIFLPMWDMISLFKK